MNTNKTDKFELAAEVAPLFGGLLETPDLQNHVLAIQHSQLEMTHLEQRDFGIGEAIGMASLLIALVSLCLQIREGHTLQGRSQDEIRSHLILKIAEETTLPPDTRERLVTKLITVLFEQSDHS